MTIGEYYVAKNTYMDIPIIEISALGSAYVPGSESFRIYFSYDSRLDGYPNRPFGATYYEVTRGLYNGKPSLKAEWFNGVGSYVKLSNNSRIVCINYWDPPSPLTVGVVDYSVKAYLKMYDAAGNYVNYTTSENIRVTVDMAAKDDGVGGLYSPTPTGGAWIFASMNYTTWGDYLAAIDDAIAGNRSYLSVALYRSILYRKDILNISNYYMGYDPPASLNSESPGIVVAPNRDSDLARLKSFFSGITGDFSEIQTGFNTDPSIPQGGDGDYDNLETSDAIVTVDPTDFTGASTLGGLNTYVMDTAAMFGFHDFMFSDAFNNAWESVRKMFGDPQSCIVGLRCVYTPVPVGSEVFVHVGNLATTVSAPVVLKDYVQLDCGSIEIPEVWGNFLDYDPYTSISLYLPYCTTVQLSANEVVGSTLSVKYNIDVLTGGCSAEVMATKTDKFGETSGIIMRATGNCSVQIPWSMIDATNQWRAIMGAAATVATAGMSITAGLSSGISGAAAAGTGAGAKIGGFVKGSLKNVDVNNTPDNVATAATSALQSVSEITQGEVVRGGNGTSISGVLQYPKPYLTIRRPIQSLAENYGRYYGYPSNITRKLSELNGFTKVGHINLENIPGTSEELALIQQALQSGVIL